MVRGRRRTRKKCKAGEVLIGHGRRAKCVKKRTAIKQLRKDFFAAQDRAFGGIDDMETILGDIEDMTTDEPGGLTSEESEDLLESISKSVMHFEDMKGKLESVEDGLGLPVEEDDDY